MTIDTHCTQMNRLCHKESLQECCVLSFRRGLINKEDPSFKEHHQTSFMEGDYYAIGKERIMIHPSAIGRRFINSRIICGATTVILFYIGIISWLVVSPPPRPAIIDKTSELNALLQAQWSSYTNRHNNWRGNISLYVETPSNGAYFATTAVGVDPRRRHFRAASTTKMFTAAAIMLLYQESALDIDGRMIDYAPNYTIPQSDTITVRQLLEHRAGVWDIPNEPYTADGLPYTRGILAQDAFHQFTVDEFVLFLRETNNTYNETGEFHYSNTGYAILGALVERISGQRFDEFVRERFFDPLQMNNSFLPWRSNDQVLPLSYDKGYALRDNTSLLIDELNVSEHMGEGNLVTVLLDLAKWVVSLLTNRTALSGETLESMLTTKPITNDSTTEYGLGIIYAPGLGYGHTGAIDGYGTRAFYSPIDRITVVLSATAYNEDALEEYEAFLTELCYSAKRLFTPN